MSNCILNSRSIRDASVSLAKNSQFSGFAIAIQYVQLECRKTEIETRKRREIPTVDYPSGAFYKVCLFDKKPDVYRILEVPSILERTVPTFVRR